MRLAACIALINYIVVKSVLTHCEGNLVSMVPASPMVAIKSQLVMKATGGQNKLLSPNCTIVTNKGKTTDKPNEKRTETL